MFNKIKLFLLKSNDIRLFKLKPLTLSMSLSLLISTLLIVTTSLFALYTVYSINDRAEQYSNEVFGLKYTLSMLLLKNFKLDVENKNFSITKNSIDILKQDSLLVYAYVKNDVQDKVVLGEKLNNSDDMKYNNLKDVQNITKTFGDYTIYIGIPMKANNNTHINDFFTDILKLLLVFVIIGIIASIAIARIISKPLEELSSAAKKITEGNFDIKMDNAEFKEINDLIYSYNEMSFQLNELYSSLELKVQERTIALETANYKLKETQAMMVHSEKMRSLGELVAGIAHEINNPVNFIHGNIMILQNYADDLIKLIDLYDEQTANLGEEAKSKIEALRKNIDIDFVRDDIKELIRSCIEGTQRTKNIVLDLKNFSRMEEMVLTQFDIPKEIDTTLNILNNKYKNRITVVKNYQENVPKIEAYGGQLNQVFMNILDNAQDAMAETGMLTINLSKEYNKVKIEFIDTGSGIAPENLRKVFDPFFTTKTVGKGTGLGMSISYRVIKDHNGTIEVESEVGKGTKFTIILPINHDQKEETIDEQIIRDLQEENGVIDG